MSLHIGSKNIIDIRRGSKKIAKVYKGNKLVWGYTPSDVLFDSSQSGYGAGTYTLYVKCRCRLEIWAVGGGGGGRHTFQMTTTQNWWYDECPGSSGGYIHGIKEVPAGTYTIKVGARGSGGGASGNGGNSVVFGETAGGGKGGAKGTVSGGVNVTNLEDNVPGKSVQGVAKSYSDPELAGAPSVYGGYGAGNTSYNRGGTEGYVKIVAL